ncbi:MAG: ferritin-like domain-containing protein, partial [Flavitalea sp.]
MAKAKTTSAKSKSAGTGKDNTLLQKLFLDSLKDIYYAEKAIAKTLPKMKKAATSEELKAAFDDHLIMTKDQVTRLEEVFSLLEKKASGKKCEAIEGIIKEGLSIIEDTDQGTSTRDVGLILAAQKVEHYEIATYGGLQQLATTLGYDEAAGLLGVTLDEEKQTDQLLTSIAEENINYEA